MTDAENDFKAIFDAVQGAAEPIADTTRFALVEIFGHRRHVGAISDLEIAGGRFLQVHDIDTGKTHAYGASSIFGLTMLTAAEMVEYVKEQQAHKVRAERYRLGYEQTAETPDDDF